MTMQKASEPTEPNTAPRAVAGQFEDADDDEDVPLNNLTSAVVPPEATMEKASPPPPSQLKRRISTNTNEATKALLAIANAPPRKKKKTFVVRLEEIREYRERHGEPPAAHHSAANKEPWEQNLQSWLEDCRKQFREGSLSHEKANALHDLGCPGFVREDIVVGQRPPQSAFPPKPTSHPALRALWLKRQEEEARMMQFRRFQAAGGDYPMVAAPTATRRRMDPDGDTPTDSEIYPSESVTETPRTMAAVRGEQQQQQRPGAYPNAAMREEQLALEEMYAAREQMARDAFLREQLMMREQRIAQAMAAQRRLSMGYGGAFPPQAAALMPPQAQGRVMSLLQPLESVPPRADPFLGARAAAAGVGSMDPRMNAMLMQRAASLQQAQAQQEAMFRRSSDASGGPNEVLPSHQFRRNSMDGTAPNAAVDGELSTAPRCRKTWDERMQEMWEFFLTHGHTQVQTRGHHKELGRWLSTVRCRLRDGLLPPNQAKEFLAMEQWTLDDEDGEHHQGLNTPLIKRMVKTLPSPNSKNKTKRALPKSWHQSFLELKEFKQKFGHCDVKMIVNSPYGLLGKWLASQRSRHKLGQLPIDKVVRLREMGCIGFEEGGKVPHRSEYRADDEEAEFDQAIRRLKEARAMGEEIVVEDPNSAPCSPTATREKRVRHSYETRVEHIKAFKEKHGHCKIRLGSSDKHEELLARWLASARSRYRGGQFREERAQELRALGCDGFEIVGNTTNTYGDEDSTGSMDDGDYSTSRKRDLEAASPSTAPSLELEGGGESEAKKQRGSGKRQSFDDMLKELESYQYVFGVGCSVPKPDGEKGKLGRWLAFQRRQFIAGKLSRERIARLQAIGRKEFNQSALAVRAAERAAAFNSPFQ